jgi:hypothetical protein
MGATIVAALKSVFMKLVIAFTTQKFLEWLLFWVAEAIVKSTKNTKDDQFLEELKKSYYEGGKE